MQSAKGKVQEKGYTASFPILYNINGVPTYVMSLKDKAGLVSEIIALAWADEVSFDAIERVHGLPEKDVIALMFEPQNPVATGPGASA